MILLSSIQSLSLVLSGTATNEPNFTCSYVDLNNKTFSAYGSVVGLANDTTPVTIVNSPQSGLTRQVKFISVYNTDTSSQQVTIQLNTILYQEGTTNQIGTDVTQVFSVLLQPGYTLIYDNKLTILDANGLIQVG